MDTYTKIKICNLIYIENINHFTVKSLYSILNSKGIYVDYYELKKLINSLVSTGNLNNNIWDYTLVEF